MNLEVKVVANAKEEKIEKQDQNKLKIWIKAKPLDGKANKAVINLISESFDVPKSSIRIIKGEKSRDKVIEISD